MPLALACLAALAGCGESAMDSKANPADPQQVALGAKVYAQHCAACHGAKLEGQPNWRSPLPATGRMPAPPHDESGHTWHHTDEVLFGITKEGLVPGKFAPPGHRSDMPAFGSTLSDDEIWAVLAYLKSHWKTPALLEAREEMIRNARRR
jgi:mono/diheme cytochrome c family protein